MIWRNRETGKKNDEKLAFLENTKKRNHLKPPSNQTRQAKADSGGGTKDLEPHGAIYSRRKKRNVSVASFWEQLKRKVHS